MKLFLFLFVPLLAPAAELKLKSAETQTPLLELYTSESCSSCPPADKWFSRLKKTEGLWQKFVPIVFHVDYWNHLNWTDDLSSREMSQRQRSIAQGWSKPSVYTPGVVFNGQEWQGWRATSVPSPFKGERVGELDLSCKGRTCNAQFSPKEKGDKKYRIHVALLGFDIQSKVTSGENSGSLLTHDFSVLDWQSEEARSLQKIEFKELKPKRIAKSYAVVAWVELKNSPQPLQSVGGVLQ